MTVVETPVSQTQQRDWFLPLTISSAALLLFGLSSLRHALFQSGALDLGYHDQIVYLISRGEPPIISFWGYHFLGAHAEWIYYPLSLLYRVYADVHWLLAIQAGSLAIAAWPLSRLAQQAGLNQKLTRLVVIAYLLYPVVFNINLFDFHPEVMAVPLLLTAVWAARAQRTGIFLLMLTLVLGCRASLALLVVFVGLWLLLFEKRRWYGLYGMVAGTTWFLFFSQVLVPRFKPDGYHALERYGALGNSISEVLVNTVLQPGLALQQLFTLANLEYLVLLCLPLIWGISLRHLTPLVACLPILAMNLLSDYPAQKNLIFQYSVPILPFLMLVVVHTLADRAEWAKYRRWMLLWSLACFFALTKYTDFAGKYLTALDTWSASRAALSQIEPTGAVLANHDYVPHLTHRPLIHVAANPGHPYFPNLPDINGYRYVFLNVRHPGHPSTAEYLQALADQLKTNPGFTVRLEQDGVYLFESR